jgi:hypothetical protein
VRATIVLSTSLLLSSDSVPVKKEEKLLVGLVANVRHDLFIYFSNERTRSRSRPQRANTLCGVSPMMIRPLLLFLPFRACSCRRAFLFGSCSVPLLCPGEAPPCPPMRGKQASGSFTASLLLLLNKKTKHSARSRYADATAMKPCFFFAAVISPSLMQLRDGVSDVDDRRQKPVCTEMMKMAARSGRFLRLRLKERTTVAFAWR